MPNGQGEIANWQKMQKAKEARIKTVCPFWHTTESAHLLNAEGV